MADIQLGIDVDSSEVVQADQAMDRLTGSLRDLERQSGRTASAAERADRAWRGNTDAARQGEIRTRAAVAQYQRLSAVWASLATLAGGVLVGGLLRTADAYTEVTNKLRVVSAEQTNVNKLFTQLLDVANRTRTPVEAIAQLYQRASLASKELGASQEQMLQFTENVGKALALQGGSAAAASGALLQLSQALGGGIVRAEEFNSILEGAFPIAQAAARGIDAAGGSVAKLRTLVIEGKVSSDAFFQAILSQTEELEAAFAQTSPTISQALTVLRNNMLDVVGRMNEATAVTSTLGKAILVLAENLERLVVYAGTAAAIFGARLAAGMALAAARTLTLSGALVALRAALIRTGIGLLVVGAGELVFQFTKLVTATGGWGEALRLLGEVAVGVWEGITTSASAIPPALASVWESVKAGFLSMAQGLAKVWADFLHGIAGTIPDLPGFEQALVNVNNAAVIAGSKVYEIGAAADAAAGKAAALRKEAEGLAVSGFDKAAAAAGKLSAQVDKTNTELNASAGSAEKLSGSLGGEAGGGGGGGGAAGAASRLADELARAKDILNDQVLAHQNVLDKLNGAKTEAGFVADETRRLTDALQDSGRSLDDFLQTVGMTREEYTRMLQETEKVTAQIEHQKKAAGELVTAMRGLAFGTITGAEGVGGIVSALTSSAFGDTLDKAFENAADTLAGAFSRSMSRLNSIGLSDTAVASVGTGIGIAATGVLNGNAQQIGTGIGSAIGGVAGDMIGSSIGGAIGGIAGPIGMVLGGLAGGFLSKIFGGGDEDKWKTVAGTAFTGTTYEASVTTGGSVNTKTDQGFHPEGPFAFEGTKALLQDFNRELSEYVEALGGTMQKGLRLVVDQEKALKAITGFEHGAPYKGAEGAKAAEDIAKKVAEVMGLAAALAEEAGPPLTTAQKLWRETQERFSKENMEILRSLGFSAKEMYEQQAEIRRNLGQGFNKEMLDTIVDLGSATRTELDQWKAYELKSLRERRDANLATAKEVGSSVALVNSAFRAERKGIEREWREMLAELTGEVADAAERQRQARGVNMESIGILVESERATKWLVDKWKEYEIQALEERRMAAVRSAREIGASVKLVNLAFAAQRDDIVSNWRGMLDDLAEETAQGPSRLERVSSGAGILGELVGMGRANRSEIDRWARLERAVLIERRTEAVAEARRLGQSQMDVYRLYNEKIIQLERDRLEAIEELGSAAARRAERLSQGRGSNREMLNILVESGRATKHYIDQWKYYEFMALEERRAAAIKHAKEVGASVNLVKAAFRAQREGIVERWRELLDGLVEEVVSPTRMERLQSGTGTLRELVGLGGASRGDIGKWAAMEKALLLEQRKDALAEARRLGQSQLDVYKLYSAKILKVEKDRLEAIAALTPTRTEKFGFGADQLRALIDLQGVRARPADINRWATMQKALVNEQRKEAIAEARRLGQSVADVNRRYNWEIYQIEKQKGELLTAAARSAAEKQVDAITAVLGRLQDRLSDLESRRSEVLQELTRRAEEARQAEQALADARAGLASGALNPGGPMDRYRALQQQFGAAITAARGGDADAASRAAGLASNLLEAGRGVFASGRGYADLFRRVNAELLAVQNKFAGTAGTIERRLDAETFTEVTERSTASLLTALGRLNTSIEAVEKQIKDQTKKLELAQQKANLAA